MLYIQIVNGKVTNAADVSEMTDAERKEFNDRTRQNPTWESGWHIAKTFAEAEDIAHQLDELLVDSDRVFIAIDMGAGVGPRFRVEQFKFRVGMEVSYGINGDVRPDGTITSISKTRQIRTSTGHIYRRQRLTGSWKQGGGICSLVPGHIDKLNPHV